METFHRFLTKKIHLTPSITIRKSGVIYLTQGLLRLTQVSGNDWYAVLAYDKEQNRMAIMLTQKITEAGAYKIRTYKNMDPALKRMSIVMGGSLGELSTAKIYAKDFFEYYQIPLEESRRLTPEWLPSQKILLVPLGAKKMEQKDTQEVLGVRASV